VSAQRGDGFQNEDCLIPKPRLLLLPMLPHSKTLVLCLTSCRKKLEFRLDFRWALRRRVAKYSTVEVTPYLKLVFAQELMVNIYSFFVALGKENRMIAWLFYKDWEECINAS
jgi:hypothetical protein